MYLYNTFDQTLVNERVKQFRSQTERYLQGKLSNDEFRPLRLQNGLYIQRYAPMLRISIPYGLLSSTQLRTLAHIARTYDKGYGHFTTRQNIQFNWPALEAVPDILAELASVEMHAIQTSGNCIRNITSDQYAGVIADEIEDPRPTAELIRQWATFHPEFAYLPRKFKIAVSGSQQDRAAIQVHDIGVQIVKNAQGDTGFRILAGGGLGRTPMVGAFIKDFLPQADLLSYLEAIVRVYNRYGRRDNKYKARIKILVKAVGPEQFAQMVEAEWQHIKQNEALQVPETEFARLKSFFKPFPYENLPEKNQAFEDKLLADKAFANWVARNVKAHKIPGYKIVVLSLKATGVAPGDVTDHEMEAIADLADHYSFAEVRVTHEQNLVLADVKQQDLYALWQKLQALGFATANIGYLTDIICCPGGDFCSLANAKSIPIAQQIQEKFDNLDYVYDLGEMTINISGCMNACGHHHVGNIGILGVDKKGAEYYQISLGGSSDNKAAIGDILGPSFEQHEIAEVIGKIVDVYVEQREPDELFIETVRRVGLTPFKERVYDKAH